MVLAGAGTGKTRVLVNRIAYLLEHGASAHDVLAVTFTNKAANEMRERLHGLLGMWSGEMWIGTFHATCARLLRIYGEHVGLPRDFSIFDDDDQRRVLNSLLKEERIDDQVTPRVMANQIDRIKSRGEDPMASEGGRGDELLRHIYPLYQRRLQQEGAVDFNDLLLKVLELAEATEVGPTLGQRFRHILVDEFQDTNRVQYRLLHNLSRAYRTLTVVGDDDQSIYSWRGAEPRNLLHFDRDFRGTEVVKLEQNYRSTQTILDAANAVIACNRNRRDKALWTELGHGEPLLWEECSDERDESNFIARAIRGLVDAEGRSFDDMAVLYRTRAQSRVLEEQCRRYEIPYRVVGDLSFFQRREIKDAIAYLRLILRPQADTSFERIINVPTRGIGKTTLERLRAHARRTGISLHDAAEECGRGGVGAISAGPRKKLLAFIDMLTGLREVASSGVSVAEFLIQVVERSGYRARLENEGTPEAQDRLSNLAELVSMASDFDEDTNGQGGLSEFDTRISLSSSMDESDGRGQGAATLMTIHAAKGLEFPVVFLCGLEDGLFPSLRDRGGMDDEDAMEEEFRLAYVAMTRAKERLILTNARTRRQWGEVRFNRPSRFLDAIPDHCLSMREEVARREASAADDPDEAPNPYGDSVGDSYDESYDEFDQTPPRRSSRGGGVRSTNSRTKKRNTDYSYNEFDQRSEYELAETSDDTGSNSVSAGEQPLHATRARRSKRPARRKSRPGAALHAGTIVSHQSFGTGKVIQVDSDGADGKLLIDFNSVGLKTVIARFVTVVE